MTLIFYKGRGLKMVQITNWSQDAYLKALNFAIVAHEGQTYGGHAPGQRIPYVNHLGSVAMELIWVLNSCTELNGELAVQCALLHDTIEDTDVDFKTLKKIFGTDIAQGVQALTKDKKLPAKGEQMLDSLCRIKSQPKEVWMVKLADRITNLAPPPFYWDNTKKQGYQEEALVIHEYLYEANELLSQRLLARIEAYKKYMGKP